MNNKFKGLYGENISCFFLRIKFYRIIARNYRNKFGEIDIIAAKKNHLVFVEVKFRTNPNEFDQVVRDRQISRLRNAANFYMMKHRSQYNYSYIRFDLILFKNYFNLVHYKNIWEKND